MAANTPAGAYGQISDPDVAGTAPAIDHDNLAFAAAGAGVAQATGCRLRVAVNTSRQVRYRLSTSTTDHYVYISTAGRVDTGGRPA